MSLKLKPPTSSAPLQPFSWDNLPTSPGASSASDVPQSPPTTWLNAKDDMKMFGAEPLRAEVGVVKCKDCDKPVLRCAIVEHIDICQKIRSGQKKGSKKRKAEDDDSLDDPAKKKSKAATKVAKGGRFKGPIDYDKHCGVINDKGLPCSRSLTCKSHSMGAKRAVLGRSKDYDVLLLEWNRLNNPNFVEPVKRETKAERKEKKEREKAEKKRLAMEAQQAAAAAKAASGGATGGGAKKSKKSGGGGAAQANASGAPNAAAAHLHADEDENLDDVDSEGELDAMVRAVRSASVNGLLGVPLAMPYDSGTWFVARRERLRNCREALAGALKSRPGFGGPGGSIGGGAMGTASSVPATPVNSSAAPIPPSTLPQQISKILGT